MPDETRTWFTSMFSGDAQPGDVVTSRALNITKIVCREHRKEKPM